MSETRYHDYGRFIQAEDQNAVQLTYFEAGVLSGNDLSMSADKSRLQMAAGAVSTADGVVISNDAQRTLEVTPQADATIWTIAQYHDFTLEAGGFGSTYALVELTDGGSPIFGLASDLSSQGVVLGWIRYPGGSVDFEDYMLHPAPSLRVLNPLGGNRADPNIAAYWPLQHVAPLSLDAPGLYVDLAADITGADALDANNIIATTWTNANAGLSRVAALYLAPTRPVLYRPKYVELQGYACSDAGVSASVYINVAGTSTLLGTLTGSVYTGAVQRFEIPDDAFVNGAPLTSGEEWNLIVEVTLVPLATFTLKSAAVNAGPYPYEA